MAGIEAGNLDRNELLDALRGVAVLGILPVNIFYFAWPLAAVDNPLLWVATPSIDLTWRTIVHVFFEQKFITLLSVLFGISLGLFAERYPDVATPRHVRRMMVLLALGLVHAYGIWFGDILVLYAVCGLLAWPLRAASTRHLMLSGAMLIAVPSVMLALMALSLPHWPAPVVDELGHTWRPDHGVLEREVGAYRGNWMNQQALRLSTAWEQHSEGFWLWGVWRTLGLILIGMAVTKHRAWQINLKPGSLAVFAIALGLPALFLISYGWHRTLSTDDAPYALLVGPQWNYWGSLALAATYAMLVAAVYRADKPKGRSFFERLASVGRFSLTVYLGQSILGATLYYGHGLGWFGAATALLMIAHTLATWFACLWLVPVLNRRFARGPAEWLWRTLTYSRN